MKKKIQFLMMALLLITAMPVTAQVLWSDDFDSYATGTLSNDPTGQTPGEGGWYNFSVSPVDIISEIGRGNVIAMGKSSVGGGVILSKNIDSLWNNRTAGNDILMFEFDFYTENILSIVPPNTFYTPSLTFLDTTNSNNPFPFGSDIAGYQFAIIAPGRVGQELQLRTDKDAGTRVPYNYSWTRYEFFIDYNTNSAIFYIPSQNYEIEFDISNEIPNIFSIRLSNNYHNPNVYLTKYDNFKLSALPTRPSYLSTSEFVTSKFNVFPNPVTDIVTITNNENIGIEQIEVLDISGKTIKSLNYNKENEVQLNLGDFASGMYLLHIKTNEGVAVKKVVKK